MTYELKQHPTNARSNESWFLWILTARVTFQNRSLIHLQRC